MSNYRPRYPNLTATICGSQESRAKVYRKMLLAATLVDEILILWSNKIASMILAKLLPGITPKAIEGDRAKFVILPRLQLVEGQQNYSRTLFNFTHFAITVNSCPLYFS
jgi:hypothetical protein